MSNDCWSHLDCTCCTSTVEFEKKIQKEKLKFKRQTFFCLFHYVNLKQIVLFSRFFFLFPQTIGCILVSIGIWLCVSEYTENQVELQHVHWLSAKTILLTFGIITLFVAFFGWLGTLCSSKCLLHTYLLLLLLLMTGELLFGSLVLTQRRAIVKRIDFEMLHSLKHVYGKRDLDAVGAAWRSLQRSLSCCGYHSYEDWYGIDAWPSQQLLPGSCCKTPQNENVRYILGMNVTIDVDSTLHSNVSTTTFRPIAANQTSTMSEATSSPQVANGGQVCWTIHNQSCYDQIVVWFQSHAYWFLVIACLIACLQFLAFAGAIYLLKTLRFRYELNLINSNKVVYDRVQSFD